MTIIQALERCLDAKKAFDEYDAGSSYSPYKQSLHDRFEDAEQQFESELNELIDARIEAATGARP